MKRILVSALEEFKKDLPSKPGTPSKTKKHEQPTQYNHAVRELVDFILEGKECGEANKFAILGLISKWESFGSRSEGECQLNKTLKQINLLGERLLLEDDYNKTCFLISKELCSAAHRIQRRKEPTAVKPVLIFT